MKPPYWKITASCRNPRHGIVFRFVVERKVKADRLPTVVVCPKCRIWCPIEASEEVTA